MIALCGIIVLRNREWSIKLLHCAVLSSTSTKQNINTKCAKFKICANLKMRKAENRRKI